jgi:hypothetical protein
MPRLRDCVVFLAGVEFFYTFIHLILELLVPLPLNLNFMEITHSFNHFGLIMNGVATFGLIWWAKQLPR